MILVVPKNSEDPLSHSRAEWGHSGADDVPLTSVVSHHATGRSLSTSGSGVSIWEKDFQDRLCWARRLLQDSQQGSASLWLLDQDQQSSVI